MNTSFDLSTFESAQNASLCDGAKSVIQRTASTAAPDETLPLRIMQAASFYPAYLEQFYRSRPGLSIQSSVRQTEELLKDAFSGIHMVVPYIHDKGYITEFTVHSAKPLQRAWAKEHGVPFPERSWEEKMLRHRVEEWRPDVLYLTDAVRFDRHFLDSLSWRPRLVIGWRGADVPFSTDWRGYDIILSGLPRLLEVAEHLGARRGVMFHPGMPHWIADAVADINQDTDVCFVGSILPFQHNKRRALLDGLSQAATKHGFSLALYLTCHPSLLTPAMQPYLRRPIFGLAMHKAMRHARIVVDDRANHGLIMPDGSKKIDLGGEDTINMRMFEVTGIGSLLLTEDLQGVRRYFDPGTEVAVWKNQQDMLDNILYYLKHEKERATIAEAGKRRCLTEHSMKNAIQRFTSIIQDALDVSTAKC